MVKLRILTIGDLRIADTDEQPNETQDFVRHCPSLEHLCFPMVSGAALRKLAGLKALQVLWLHRSPHDNPATEKELKEADSAALEVALPDIFKSCENLRSLAIPSTPSDEVTQVCCALFVLVRCGREELRLVFFPPPPPF